VRENGLRAAAYVAVIDLHPQVADVMLEALAAEGVAAYAAPVGSARGILLPAQFPTGPLDRLFVDRDAYDRARRVLDQNLPRARAELEPAPVEASARTTTGDEAGPIEAPDHGRDLVDDDTWSRIVATFHGDALNRPVDQTSGGEPTVAAPVEPEQPGSGQAESGQAESGQAESGPTGPVRAWPEAEDLAAVTDDAPALRRPGGTPGPGSSGPNPREQQHAAELDRYEPPLPPPLPVADQTTRLAWAGVVGGPVLFILALLLDWELASWAQLAGVTGLVVGFVTLVARMRDETPDDDPDNGAVV